MHTADIGESMPIGRARYGLLCNEDDPTTDNIAVALVDDDDSEENDESAASGDLPLGITVNRIARDSDWYTVNFLDRSQLSVRAAHGAHAAPGLLLSLPGRPPRARDHRWPPR